MPSSRRRSIAHTGTIPLLLSSLSLFSAVPTLVSAQGGLRNITVDDSDPSITYSGSWATTNSDLAGNGSVHFTNDEKAEIKFSFTGIAFYYLSPTYPFPMEAILSITTSTGQIELLSLLLPPSSFLLTTLHYLHTNDTYAMRYDATGNSTDGMYNRSAPHQDNKPGGETGPFQVVFSINPEDGTLKNEKHDVDIIQGRNGGLSFDGFIYTVNDSDTSSSGSGGDGNGNDNGTNGDDDKNSAMGLRSGGAAGFATTTLLAASVAGLSYLCIG
ncbi:hypothetical protein D9758_006982 [Tetrapyrgos nigripes]|uniref:Uncharacterized protein n=1 Tax=Tetrapyrgos nigripes TaxID=182062 RepID=A0A8H5GSF6_9AGAR|nr:hypothetical protein D9758_006982 [Tetrapyrgos nigripes]